LAGQQGFKRRIEKESYIFIIHSHFPYKERSPSSSQVKDIGLSRRQQGFKSPWGRQRKRGSKTYYLFLHK
jgi:hypothetical protein